eukprot:972369-Prorocentrum_minimum.AAC.1
MFSPLLRLVPAYESYERLAFAVGGLNSRAIEKRGGLNKCPCRVQYLGLRRAWRSCTPPARGRPPCNRASSWPPATVGSRAARASAVGFRAACAY